MGVWIILHKKGHLEKTSIEDRIFIDSNEMLFIEI